MRNMADAIEAFLQKLLEASENNVIEIQRGDIASIFSCAPSQINYVLQTRFVPEKGYYVESRRGGGGYIRISKADDTRAEMIKKALSYCREPIRQEQASHVLAMLLDGGLITHRECRMIQAANHRDTLLFELTWRDQLRGSLMRAILGTLLTNEEVEK